MNIQIHCKYDELVDPKKLKNNPLWVDVKGFSEYSISSNGEVKNKKTGRVLKQARSGYKSNYRSVCLWREKKCHGPKYVHRLVLQSFVGEGKLLQAAHLDGNPLNNSILNLKWVTPKENSSHKYIHGTMLSGDKHQSTVINGDLLLGVVKNFLSGMNASEIARDLNVSNSHISGILRGSKRTNSIYCPLVVQQIDKKKKSIKSKTARKNSPWK